MRVAVTGASGLIGSALGHELWRAGHTVVALVRREAGAGEVSWDPERGEVDVAGLKGVDALVHLAADPITPRPLTSAKRRRLRDSRVHGTATIAQALARMDDGPRVLLSASGVNWYGDRGSEVLTEASPPGDDGFLSRITVEWEQALEPARAAGIRTVAMRMGIVLDREATILKVLGTLTKMGGAAVIGSGEQYWPWIGVEDVAGIYRHVLEADDLDGVVNVTAPVPATNAQFTRTLARVLRRPLLPVKVPRVAPAALLGRDLARSLVLTSMRVRPERMLAGAYSFRFPDLEPTLRHLYSR
jgi:uncharacterized protein